HIARTVALESVERPLTRADDRTPGGRPVAATVERLDQGKEVVELRAALRVDEDVVANARMTLAHREGGVEVTRLQEDQRVRAHRIHAASIQPKIPGFSSRGYVCERSSSSR